MYAFASEELKIWQWHTSWKVKLCSMAIPSCRWTVLVLWDGFTSTWVHLKVYGFPCDGTDKGIFSSSYRDSQDARANIVFGRIWVKIMNVRSRFSKSTVFPVEPISLAYNCNTLQKKWVINKYQKEKKGKEKKTLKKLFGFTHVIIYSRTTGNCPVSTAFCKTETSLQTGMK